MSSDHSKENKNVAKQAIKNNYITRHFLLAVGKLKRFPLSLYTSRIRTDTLFWNKTS